MLCNHLVKVLNSIIGLTKIWNFSFHLFVACALKSERLAFQSCYIVKLLLANKLMRFFKYFSQWVKAKVDLYVVPYLLVKWQNLVSNIHGIKTVNMAEFSKWGLKFFFNKDQSKNLEGTLWVMMYEIKLKRGIVFNILQSNLHIYSIYLLTSSKFYPKAFLEKWQSFWLFSTVNV